MRKRRLTLMVAGGAVAVLAFVAFVWPTVYRYDHMNLGEMVLPVRVHRIAGTTEILFPDGWRVAKGSPTRSPKLSDVPPAEIAKLQGKARIEYGSLSCTLYNGSNWKIREIVVHLRIFASISESAIVERDYRLANEYFTDPLETGIFDEYVDLQLEPDQHFTWHIKSARGEPE